jgi:hypothetical protein
MKRAAAVEVARALDFAARKHRDQRRKGASAEPYINHPAEVARLVAEATGGRPLAVLLAALLHDTVEDTQTTLDELEREFGTDVAALVAEVTDDKRLPKAERKRLQVEHAGTRSSGAKLIKIADKTSNLRSLLESPPTDWDLQRPARVLRVGEARGGRLPRREPEARARVRRRVPRRRRGAPKLEPRCSARSPSMSRSTRAPTACASSPRDSEDATCRRVATTSGCRRSGRANDCYGA